MYKEDDEEYKKRLQRAQELRENLAKASKEPEMASMKIIDKRTKDSLPKLEIKKSEALPIKQNINTTQTVQLPNNSTDKLNITRPSTSNLSFKTINPSNVKISSEEEKNNPNMITVNTSDIKAIKEAEETNKAIEKGGIDKFNAIVGNTLNSFQGGFMQGSTGLANAVLIPTAAATKGINDVYKKISGNKEENGLDDFYNGVLDNVDELSDRASFNARVNSQIDDKFTKTIGGASGSVGNMGPSIVSNFVVPGSGLTVLGVGAAGNSAQETLNEDRSNMGQAMLTGILKGAVEVLTEKLTGGNILGKGSLDDVAIHFIGNNVKNKVGQKVLSKIYEYGGEMLEEQISDHAGYIIDKLINDKDIPDFKGRWEQFNETNKQTFLSTLMLNMLGLGGGTYNEVQEYLGEKNTQKYLNEAQKIINQENITDKIKNNIIEKATKMEEQTQQAISQENKTTQNGLLEQIKYNKIEQKVNEYIEGVKDNFYTDINIDSKIINQQGVAPINYKTQNEVTVFRKAKSIFDTLQKKVFKNGNTEIYVDNGDIKESIHHTLKDNVQKRLLNENLAIYSQLDKVIETAKEISSDTENKGRNKFSDWKYYASNVNIDGNPYVVEFDTTMKDGERHFRLERLYKINNADVATDSAYIMPPRFECNICY